MSQPPDAEPSGSRSDAGATSLAVRGATLRRLAWIPVVIAVVLAGAIVGLAKHGSSAAPSGAASPEAAVRAAVESIARQDVSGLLAVMNPGEVRSLSSLLAVVREKASKAGLMRASGVPMPWLRLEATGLTLKTERPRDGLAFVSLTGGAVSSTVDEAAMPEALRPQNPHTIQGGVVLGGSASANSAGYGRLPGALEVVGVVEEGGRWYISPTTTALEELRRAIGLPQPDFTDPTPLDGGASTPAGVLTGLASAIENHDLRRAAGYVSSKDVPGISYYYGSFAAQLDLLSRFVDTKVSQIDATVEPMSNGLQKVVVHGFSASLRTPGGGGGSVRYASGCFMTPNSKQPACSFADLLQHALGVDQPFVVVEKNNGKWQISPVATMLEYLRVFLTQDSLNQTYLRFGIPEFSPVVATLGTNTDTHVALNDADYAHLVLKGQPNSCVDVETPHDASVQLVGGGPATAPGRCPAADGGSDNHHLVTIPASGAVDLIVFGHDAGQPGVVDVKVRS